MKIEAHKQAKPRQTGKDVKPFYDMKRERERAAVEAVRLRHRRDAAAKADTTTTRRRPSRIAAE
jgi:aminoglycoside phosphotransferase family enzyme